LALKPPRIAIIKPEGEIRPILALTCHSDLPIPAFLSVNSSAKHLWWRITVLSGTSTVYKTDESYRHSRRVGFHSAVEITKGSTIVDTSAAPDKTASAL